MSIFDQNTFMKGMNYASFHPTVFASEASDEAIDHLANTGVNWVAINVFWYQDDRRATEIGPHKTKTATDESLLHLIQKIRSKGQQVLLKPMVDARDHTWRAKFSPRTWGAWFESYTQMLIHYAQLAEEQELDLLCIGCEFPMRKKVQKHWRKLIQQIREIYSGPLTYAANHDKKSGFKRVKFWNKLDYIGIDAYFSVCEKGENTIPQMQKGWNHCILQLEKWYRRTDQKSPVLFTELGATSVKGGATEPWDYKQQDEPNWEEQANYYESFFRSFEQRDWLQGAFWWWWDNPSTGDYLHFDNSDHKTSYTPKGKDAEEVIKRFWV